MELTLDKRTSSTQSAQSKTSCTLSKTCTEQDCFLECVSWKTLLGTQGKQCQISKH